MQIISKRKDYYDYVAGMYGGGDPLVRYDRTKEYPDVLQRKELEELHDLPQRRYGSKNTKEYSWLIVCGKYHMIHRKRKTPEHPWQAWVLLSEAKSPKLVEKITKSYWFRTRTIEYYISSKEQPFLNMLSKKVRMPIFILTWEDKPYGAARASSIHLGDLGYAAITEATQMYQEVAYYVSTHLLNKDEPLQVGNKEKIEQHGFDLRKSFRHRK